MTLTVECPNCRNVLPFKCSFHKTWTCRHCGAVLTFARTRPVLPMLGAFAAYLLVIFPVLTLLVAMLIPASLAPQVPYFSLVLASPLVFFIVKVVDRFLRRAVVAEGSLSAMTSRQPERSAGYTRTGLFECPNCRRPLPFKRRFHKTWTCEQCGSTLTFGGVKPLLPRFAAFAICVVVVFPLLSALIAAVSPLHRAPRWFYFQLPLLLLVAYPFVKLVDRFMHRTVVILDRTGVHCRQCGYDLEGNVSGKCPECGTAAELSQSK